MRWSRGSARAGAALHGRHVRVLRAAAGSVAREVRGQLLHVKPILTIEEGEVIPLKRVRGAAMAFAEFQRAVRSTTIDSPNLRVGIAHAEAPERRKRCARSSGTSGRTPRSRS